ncbi:dipeptide ABC transporter ATP-binding protein [Paraburkholderia sp. CNPSo 3155]|uniref:dipeptide ABC transporter ATP-binding protein n=1 Tax=Paraburkholderia atlantica TaxID=2654982 RepID=UPI00128E562D|nr:ABC transporter ATP-binding protein [Paraburkholderia atlantica]MPW09020.1 dipeptide ABC transporter ATP-binding protein [Paraburkholderia atlantica]
MSVETNDVLVKVENLRIGLPGADAIVSKGVSFELRPGRCLALVGESGSGKSLTARSLVGLAGEGLVVRADTFEIGGENALGFSREDWQRIRGKEIGLVLQDALTSLDPLRTLRREITETLEAHKIGTRAERASKAVALLKAVGIRDAEHRVDSYSHQLSGGQRQRALIASAISADAKVIIADEPTTALDVTVQKRILSVLQRRRDDGAALLLISHDLAMVSGIADDVLILKDGVVVERGPIGTVLRYPEHPYTRQLLAAIPARSSRGYYLSQFAASPQAGHGLKRIAAPVHTPSTDELVLEVRNLAKVYGGAKAIRRGAGFTAVSDVSFQVRRGETLGIVGESGSGKSTILKIVLGLLAPTTGEVLLNGEPWSSLKEVDRRPHRAYAQLISQDPLSSFDPRSPVGRLIEEPLLNSVPNAVDRQRRVLEVLDQVHLPRSVLERNPRSMSGGQRQRVAIARALAPTPSLIVCDEPVSALDVVVQAQVLDLLVELRAEHGTTILFVSHDLGVVHHVADRVVVLKDGRIVEEGETETVFRSPRDTYTQELIGSIAKIAS